MEKYHKMLELDKVLNEVITEMYLDWNKKTFLDTPLQNDLICIQHMLDEVDEAVMLSYRMGPFPLYFHQHVGLILSKANKSGVLSEEEVVNVGQLLDSIRDIHIYIEKCEQNDIEAPLFNAHLDNLTYLKDLNMQIKSIVTPFGEIKDDASKALKDIRRKQKEYEKSIQQKLQEIMQKNSGQLTQALVSIRNNRYVVPVKNEYKNTFKGIIHDQSASGETYFIEPAAVHQLNNALNASKEEEQREIYRILRDLSGAIALHYDECNLSYDTLLHLDVTFAKARYAIKLNAKKPSVNKDGIIDLIQCRHPLLKVENIVANNVRLGKDYQGIIITGPNTGGKTVLLKTVGLLSLMVKCGLLLPCADNSTMMIFDDVFCDIGDEQSIDQNLSTFSSHLRNVIDMVNHVSRNSLVLLDELGSGTDPLEGSSLAISIIEHLLDINCLIIATSHYSELKLYAFHSDKIINASVAFDIQTLQPTYKLMIGIPGMSNALQIAKNLGLKSEIIRKAESYVYERNDDVNRMLEKLIQQTFDLDQKLSAVDADKQKLQEKLREVDDERQRILQQESSIITNANEEAKRLIARSMQNINDLLDELKSMKNKSVKLPELAELTHRSRTLEDNLISEKIIEETPHISIGDQVYVQTHQCYGKVLKELKNDQFDVLIGNATMKIKRKHLQPTSTNDKHEKVIRQSSSFVGPKQRITATLDLRGKRYEEASPLIDKFIDDAVFANLHLITIIHGFGTGVIRKLVHDTLKNHSFVESFRFGGANEGGQGVTVATLKDK